MWEVSMKDKEVGGCCATFYTLQDLVHPHLDNSLSINARSGYNNDATRLSRATPVIFLNQGSFKLPL